MVKAEPEEDVNMDPVVDSSNFSSTIAGEMSSIVSTSKARCNIEIDPCEEDCPCVEGCKLTYCCVMKKMKRAKDKAKNDKKKAKKQREQEEKKIAAATSKGESKGTRSK